MIENIIFSLKELRTARPVWLIFILFIGFVLGSGAADVGELKQAGAGAIPAGKIIRVVSVALVGLLALLVLARSGRLSNMLKGNLMLMFIYALIALASVASSDLKTMTLYKSAELFTIIMVAATIYTHKHPEDAAKKYIIGLLWLYIFILIGVYGQLFLFGKEAFRQVSNASFQSFMLSSYYPTMAGNSLGFMGAIVTLFGAFIFFAKLTKGGKKEKAIGVIVILLSFGMVVMSYTRSILAILGLVGLIYLLYNRKYGWFFLCVTLLIASLASPQVRNAIETHMLRGDSEQNLETLSSRTMLWQMALDKDLLPLIIGEGYATGTMFIGYDTGSLLGAKIQHIRNAHNSVLEIINSTGIVGAIVWIALMLRIFFQLLKQLKRYKHLMSANERYFHILILSLSLMSILRSMMNSTYVYLDLFMPLLLAMVVYVDTFPASFKGHVKGSGKEDNSRTILKANSVIYKARSKLISSQR